MVRVEQIVKEISTLMPKMARKMHRGFLSYSKLSVSQLSIMVAIFEQGMTKAGELSKIMGVSAPSITGIVDRLVRANYIKRTPDGKDRRAINLMLTKKGQAEVKNLTNRVQQRWRTIILGLDPKDREMYLVILKKILNVLEKQNEK